MKIEPVKKYHLFGKAYGNNLWDEEYYTNWWFKAKIKTCKMRKKYHIVQIIVYH